MKCPSRTAVVCPTLLIIVRLLTWTLTVKSQVPPVAEPAEAVAIGAVVDPSVGVGDIEALGEAAPVVGEVVGVRLDGAAPEGVDITGAEGVKVREIICIAGALPPFGTMTSIDAPTTGITGV
jgi:hypothetical protein